MTAMASLETCVTEPAGTDDPAALAHLYGALVYRAAYHILGDAGLAEDVQQDVFLRVLERPPRDVVSWPAYLTTSAVRRAIDRQRQQKRWWRLLPSWRPSLPDPSASAEDTQLADECARRLRKELATLSPREAQCFSLRYLEGMTVEEIADVLSISGNAAHVTLHRARRRLEARLSDEPLEASP